MCSNWQRGAATATAAYLEPSADFVDLVDGPTAPSLALDPRERFLLLMENPPLRTVEDLSRDELKLAGIRFEPRRLLPSLAGGYTKLTLRPLFGPDGQPLSVENAPTRVVEGPSVGSKLRSVVWRPSGDGFIFVALPPGGSGDQGGFGEPELWFASFDPQASGAAAQEPIVAERVVEATGRPLRLNSIRGSPARWHPDGRRLLLSVEPWEAASAHDAAAPPAVGLGVPLQVPSGPSVQVSTPGEKAPVRTYQDLLKSPEDENLYERYTTVQWLFLDLDTRRATRIGLPDMYRAGIFSPDGAFMLVSTTRRPFSYAVPDGRFARDLEVWALPKLGDLGEGFDEGTDAVRERWPLVSLPVRDQIPTPQDAVEDMPRDFSWREDRPHTLSFVEALDNGDPRNPPSPEGFRDQVFWLEGPPYSMDVRLRGPRTEMRYSGMSTCKDGTRLLTEWRWKDRRTRTWVLPAGAAVEADGAPPSDRWLLYDRSMEDRYDSPGSFQMVVDPETRQPFLMQRPSDKALLLVGSGASPRGLRPFVDALSLEKAQELSLASEGAAPSASSTTSRLWRCVAAPGSPGDPVEDPEREVGRQLVPEEHRQNKFESVAGMLGGDGTGRDLRMLVWREAQDEPPNLFLRSLEEGAESEVAIIAFEHPQPALRDVRKQLVKYKRSDGVELNADLYLPPGYDKDRDGRLPCLMWAYPREFKSADAAGQISSSPYSFVRGSWSRPTFWLLRGYAILDDPKMPIVGEGEAEPNDTFIEQLRLNAQAAVDCVVDQLGVVDRDRICIGGHSYGAYMTAHLLAHTDLFRAGICRSGAYNRTLTPFGFQSEERTYWEATDTYTTMSPFLYAKQLAEKQAPLLLIHGQEDPNPGTFPMQSERFFQALKGHGAVSKLVLLPKERHGYLARESILHVLHEQEQWLEAHNAPRT